MVQRALYPDSLTVNIFLYLLLFIFFSLLNTNTHDLMEPLDYRLILIPKYCNICFLKIRIEKSLPPLREAVCHGPRGPEHACRLRQTGRLTCLLTWPRFCESGVSNLLVSLGHTGKRRVVLGHTLHCDM